MEPYFPFPPPNLHRSRYQAHAPSTVTAPKPPGHLFRIVRALTVTSYSSVYICLPRTLTPLSAKSASLVSSFQHLGCSTLSDAHMTLLPHLMIVRMKINLDELRRESEVLNVKGFVLHSQFTGDVQSSWVCERMVFGVSLKELGEKMAGPGEAGIPAWMVAHVLLGILDDVHDEESLFKAQDVRLDMYGDGSDDVWKYRGYPSIHVNVPTSYATGLAARAILELMCQTIVQWSDCAAYIKSTQEAGQEEIVNEDPVLWVLHNVQRLLRRSRLTMDDVRREFKNRLVDLRHTGPMHMPRSLVQNLHADVVTDEELAHALREPTRVKFRSKVDAFKKIVNGDGVQMSEGEFAGMKTVRILVVRFNKRRDDFARIMGEVKDGSKDNDVEMEMDRWSDSSEDGESGWNDETRWIHESLILSMVMQ
jgi:hypothetical protein